MTLDSDVDLKPFAETCQNFTGADYKGKKQLQVSGFTNEILFSLTSSL